MFFSANIQDMDEDYKEIIPDHPTAHSAYSLRCLTQICERTGWRVLSVVAKRPGNLPIQNSLLCAPV